jgi:5-methyltetrahydrofolate--homocysteine methyltransferase
VVAGSEAISTNTFGGNRLKLRAYGLQDRVSELNVAGIRVAREVAGDAVFVVGSLGPTGEFLEPLGDLSFEEAADVFREQAQAIADADADCILLETFADLEELKAGLAGALTTALPCLCTMPFDTNGRTMMGVSPVQAARDLTNAGASGVGANCGVGPAETLDVMQQMRGATDAVLVAQPNAGIPHIDLGRTVYDSTPSEMASYAVGLVRAGVRILGACCGSTPEHISAIREAVKAA